VRSIKGECLDRMIFFGGASLRRVLREYVVHYHVERNHQGMGNQLLEPPATVSSADEANHCRERLGGMLNFYHREAACKYSFYFLYPTRCFNEYPDESLAEWHRRLHLGGDED
jgi:hypothetical protein